MNTLVLDSSQTEIAGRILRDGGLVVFPTETVYGLGADAQNSAACTAIFAAKGRPADNPLIVHIVDPAHLELVAASVDPLSRRLFERFAPGPLTLVLPRAAGIPDVVTAGLESVAVRFPAHPVARAVISAAGTPVAAPSANRSGRPSPTDFDAAWDHMHGRVDAIVRGEPSQVGLESTVARVVGSRIELLREGAITTEMIAEVVPAGVPVVTVSSYQASVGSTAATGPLPGSAAGPAPVPSPGVRHRHYQPDARVVLAATGEVWATVSRLVSDAAGRSRIGVLAVSGRCIPTSGAIDTRVDLVTCMSLDEYARELYRCFRRFDATGCSVIVAEMPEPTGIGSAILDRLRRAAGQV
ncbi:MAG: threonylcarbamoyl-AMP synthase [Spirochaetaceae bacterium]|nr:MAG: threonylcarbamoyl-AMP synthase [Spirochaetaceae bacterium]